MEKVKKISLLLVVAVLGGLISLWGYKIFERKQAFPFDNFSQARKANYEFKSITVPSFDFADVSEAVMPTVVHIKTISNNTTTERQSSPFDLFGEGFNIPRGPQMASGSGVIISADGYIVTNNHVVNGADEIEVVLFDKRSYKADVIGTDPNTDLALVKVNASALSPIKMGSSDETRVGEWVLAVGNPFNLTSTVTAGIVSAKGRSIRLLGGGTAIESFIQTDAAVNPGNSGGALVNSKGELVGINTAIASHTGQYEGYSFAVPVSIMKKTVEDLMKFGEVQRGFLGVQIRDINAELAKEKGLNRPMGVYIEDISENSAAGSAGLKKGDIITKIDGRVMNSVPELQEIVGRKRPGDEVKVNALHNGSENEYTVILRNKDGKTGTVMSPAKKVKNELGASFEPISEDMRKKLKISSGVKVATIENGRFKDAGIPLGFIITTVDKVNVYTASDVFKALENKKGGILVEGYLPGGDKKYYVLEMGEGR